MKKRIISSGLILAALILEILPYGAVCNFANPDGEPWRRTYSYFDLTPFGYANFTPFIVAVLTVAIGIFLIVSFISKKEFKKSVTILSLAASVLSFGPLLFGISYYSIVGLCISLILVLFTFLQFA